MDAPQAKSLKERGLKIDKKLGTRLPTQLINKNYNVGMGVRGAYN